MQEKENKLKIIKGIEKVREIIIHTYGPQGRTWLIGKNNAYYINDDGYKIIKELSFEDKYENMGLKLIQDLVDKTEIEAHDCTTLVTLLATSFIHEIYTNNFEFHPKLFIKEWDNSINNIIALLEQECNKKVNEEILKSIAKICVKEDYLGELIGKTIYQLGEYGELVIKENNNEKCYVENQKGYILEGFILGDDIFDVISKDITDVKILIINDQIDTLVPLINIIKKVKEQKLNLLIICFNYYDEVYQSISNLIKNNLNIFIYKLPGYKNLQKSIIEDIQMICGAKLYSKHEVINLDLSELASIKQVEISRNFIHLYYDEIVRLIDNLSIERRAKILGKHACLYVGGNTKNMIKERLSRIEDAKYSCQNTLKYGYVLGGGKTLYNISNKIDEKSIVDKIIVKSLKDPFFALIHNSGFDTSKFPLLDEEMGIDLDNHQIISLKDKKIFDCIYGIKRAIINASGLVYTIIHLYDAKIE